ncbi:uncharacterized protein TRIADDRAFT_55808 [Trichoplax adhaerens]|uniref:Uncharacterized protein n=1 Tax=Trichoplax adhaerens TaxID=10228 RepID=B3RVX3_TRIAD|nr:hypothetical protein TRIADDRAFT_55808 [Trichoplax adhaerens]EDV26075.1 hypothetical protein TRIADDRAFT_55808 [Trichoplax adhaerens]|eukprot:XP_002112108.1 hypothetical protein TRIADDRAFT_55808 [Trichoplax adhaerens]
MFKSVKELIARDIKNVEEASHRQLLEDARKGSHLGVKALLKVCSDLSPEDDQGNTPFLLACANGHAKIMETLLNCSSGKYSKAIDVCGQNRDGDTALHLAAYSDHMNIIKILLKQPAVLKDINTVNKDGNTALHLAAIQGHHHVINALLRVPNINATKVNKDYKTPAQLAKSNGHKSLAKDMKKFASEDDKCILM